MFFLYINKIYLKTAYAVNLYLVTAREGKFFMSFYCIFNLWWMCEFHIHGFFLFDMVAQKSLRACGVNIINQSIRGICFLYLDQSPNFFFFIKLFSFARPRFEQQSYIKKTMFAWSRSRPLFTSESKFKCHIYIENKLFYTCATCSGQPFFYIRTMFTSHIFREMT